jgi:hypothetical protein
MEETLNDYFARQPKVRVKPMKPIYCPCCGAEMRLKGAKLSEHTFECINLGCKLHTIMIWGSTERAARRAWNKSLIGRVRKLINSPVYAGGTVMENSLVWWLRRMFGGDQ